MNDIEKKMNKLCKREDIALYPGYSQAILGRIMNSVRNARFDLYDTLYDDGDLNQSDKTQLMLEEYKAYCNFIDNIVNTKRLRKTTYLSMISSIANDYDIIKSLDIDSSAFDMTTDLLRQFMNEGKVPHQTYKVLHLFVFKNRSNQAETHPEKTL